MALKDLVRSEVRDLATQGENAVNACKNSLNSVLTSVNGITSAQLTSVGFSAAEKTELTNLKNKLQAIYDEIVTQGF